MKKLITGVVLACLMVSGVSADIFIPEEQLNEYTVEKHWDQCGITSGDQTSKWCLLKTDSTEFKTRLKTANWYYDFDLLMVNRIWEEMLWDYGWTEETYYLLGTEEDDGKLRAQLILENHIVGMATFHNSLLTRDNYTLDTFEERMIQKVLNTIDRLDYHLIGYEQIDFWRKKMIRDGKLENTVEYQRVYLGNIDELHDKIMDYYSDYIESDNATGTYEDVYFPNVLKFLEFEKEWSLFYRNNSNLTQDDMNDLGYSSTEITKSLAGEYNNSYENKVDFEITIKQGIGGTILDGDLPRRTIESGSEVSIELSRLEEYEDLLGKDYNTDYSRVYKSLIKWFTKFKAKGNSQIAVNQTILGLQSAVPSLINSYESKYLKTKEVKYAQYVYILLVFEKILEEKSF